MHRGHARSDKQQSRAQQVWHRECCKEIQVKSVTLIHTDCVWVGRGKKNPLKLFSIEGLASGNVTFPLMVFLLGVHLVGHSRKHWNWYPQAGGTNLEQALACFACSQVLGLSCCSVKGNPAFLLSEHQRVTVDLTVDHRDPTRILF